MINELLAIAFPILAALAAAVCIGVAVAGGMQRGSGEKFTRGKIR